MQIAYERKPHLVAFLGAIDLQSMAPRNATKCGLRSYVICILIIFCKFVQIARKLACGPRLAAHGRAQSGP